MHISSSSLLLLMAASFFSFCLQPATQSHLNESLQENTTYNKNSFEHLDMKFLTDENEKLVSKLSGDRDSEDLDSEHSSKLTHEQIMELFVSTLMRSKSFKGATNEEKLLMLENARNLGDSSYADSEAMKIAEKDLVKMIKDLKGHSTAFIKEMFEFLLFDDDREPPEIMKTDL